MKIALSAFLATVFLLSLSENLAAAPYNCQTELRKLVVPALEPSPMPKDKMQVELVDMSDGNGNPANGVYSAQITAAADSPDNLDGKVAIGWVNLDTRHMKIFDISRDEDHPQALHVNNKMYANFVRRCLERGK
ncbi:MAG: hypothetical protein V4764_18355 [Burkholderia sp.]